MSKPDGPEALSWFQRNRRQVFGALAVVLMALGFYDLLIGGQVMVGIALIAFGLLWLVRAARA